MEDIDVPTLEGVTTDNKPPTNRQRLVLEKLLDGELPMGELITDLGRSLLDL